MKKKMISGLTLSLFVLINSCNSPTETPVQYKHPREMTWVADTIAYPGSGQTMMTSLWASSPNDVWISGHNDRSQGDMWHYNGTKWEEVDVFKDVERSPKSFSKIFGVSSNDIWAVGDRLYSDPINSDNREFGTLIIQYNGTRWIEHKQTNKVRVLDLFCSNSKEIWTCGDSGMVFNYNGNSWKSDKIKIPFLSGAEFSLVSIAKHNNKTFVLASIWDSGRRENSYYFIHGNLNNWTVVDSMILDGSNHTLKWGIYGLHAASFGKLYSYGPGGIWEWNESNWFQVLNLNTSFKGFYAFRENYAFALGDFNYVYFYDGNSWTQLMNFAQTEEIIYTDAWSNGKETFILGHTFGGWPQKTVIWRGK